MSLSREEIDRAIAQLSDDDYKRIRIVAKILVRGLIQMSALDLMQETFTALLGQDRVFPSDVPPVVVIITAMRGEASNWRSREKTGAVDQHVAVSEITEADEDETAVVSVVPRNEVTPERIVSNQEIFKQIVDSLANEPELQDLAITWSMELRGQEAADYLGWEIKVYEAARKRLTRRLEEIKEDLK